MEIDKVRIQDCFRPGDLVRARVISLGDARQYTLIINGVAPSTTCRRRSRRWACGGRGRAPAEGCWCL
ncbi:unnamed protein product [Heterosigma akashiwo]